MSSTAGSWLVVYGECRQGGTDRAQYRGFLGSPECGLLCQVIEDLKEECSKYGQVLKVVVPRPPVPQQAYNLFNQQNYGKVCQASAYCPLHAELWIHLICMKPSLSVLHVCICGNGSAICCRTPIRVFDTILLCT